MWSINRFDWFMVWIQRYIKTNLYSFTTSMPLKLIYNASSSTSGAAMALNVNVSRKYLARCKWENKITPANEASRVLIQCRPTQYINHVSTTSLLCGNIINTSWWACRKVGCITSEQDSNQKRHFMKKNITFFWEKKINYNKQDMLFISLPW